MFYHQTAAAPSAHMLYIYTHVQIDIHTHDIAIPDLSTRVGPPWFANYIETPTAQGTV